jgi:hypothetical protein
MDIGANPLAVLSFIAAPAVLTNACCVLTLATSNRFARAVDRVRALASLLSNPKALDDEERSLRLRQLQFAERRVLLLVRSLSSFNMGVGAFAATAFTSLLGAVFFVMQAEMLLRATLVTAFGVGVCGVGALVWGCGLLFWEARSALRILREETQFLLSRVPRTDKTEAPL